MSPRSSTHTRTAPFLNTGIFSSTQVKIASRFSNSVTNQQQVEPLLCSGCHSNPVTAQQADFVVHQAPVAPQQRLEALGLLHHSLQLRLALRRLIMDGLTAGRRDWEKKRRPIPDHSLLMCFVPVPMTAQLLGRWACRPHWSAWSAQRQWWRATLSARSTPYATSWTTSVFSPAPIYSQLPTHS